MSSFNREIMEKHMVGVHDVAYFFPLYNQYMYHLLCNINLVFFFIFFVHCNRKQ
jgi:hypothetical protein